MAYDSLVSLAKAINEYLIHVEYPYTLPGYGQIKSIHRHANSMLALLHDSPIKTIEEILMFPLSLPQYPFSLPTNEDIFQDVKSIHDHAASLLSENETMISLERRVKDVANKAEDTIQFFMSEKNRSKRGGRKSKFKLKRDLRKAAEEMKSIVGELEIMKDSVTIQDSPLTDSSSRFAPTTAQNDMVFGFDNDLVKIRDLLFEEEEQTPKILPIVGSGGIGKTTLARYVYDDPLIVEYFPIRAWVTVSHDYSQMDILRCLLVSLGVQIEEISVESIATVKQILRDERFLIVMDDVWSTKQLRDDINTIFKETGNRSRFILTTRRSDVATYLAYHVPSPHQMNLMNDDQSWYLLQNKVFGEQGCPREFELIGRKIARGCGGLPLSIVIMADLLSSIPITLHSWEAISEDVLSAIYTKDGPLEKMISSSFMELPHHLRLCLLYMGGFPEDYEFSISMLTKLWIAEGFVKPDGYKTFEEVAEEYVQDLVNRSLVMVASRNHLINKSLFMRHTKNHLIKSCRLQNVVRDFCIRKIQEDKFLLPVVDYLPDTTLRRFFLPNILKNQHRIILNSYDLHLRETIHNSPLRTIICIEKGRYWSMGSVQKFPLIKVLHVVNKSENLGWESDQVFELIHLRYLASNILSSSIPASISKLQNLQTLIIYRHGVRLPEEILGLTQLRHLIAFSFHPLPHPKVATSPLKSLQTFSLASNFECSEMILNIVPNLTKLKICYSEDTSEQDYHLNNLWNLRRLENLKLDVHKDFSFGRKPNPVFPDRLRKLTLSGCRLPWKDMTIVGSLPNLEVLKLRDFAFQGDEWRLTKGEFQSLKYLLIDGSDLQLLWASSWPESFHKLVCLLVYRCPYLQGIPYGIGSIRKLELLEVDDRNESLVESAKYIQEYKEMCGNKSFRVRVKDF